MEKTESMDSLDSELNKALDELYQLSDMFDVDYQSCCDVDGASSFSWSTDNAALSTPNEDKLTLSDEERALLTRHGFMLPNNRPLTKEEEKALRFVRRKIRNKESAKVSRKKKRQYIEGLERRVKLSTIQNWQLQRRVEELEAQNLSMWKYFSKFQSLMTRPTDGQLFSRPTGTYLMAFVLSFAVVLPLFSTILRQNVGLTQTQVTTTTDNGGPPDSRPPTKLPFKEDPVLFSVAVDVTDDPIGDVTEPVCKASNKTSGEFYQDRSGMTSTSCKNETICLEDQKDGGRPS